MMSMAETQGATPPAWLGRPRWRLLLDVLGGLRANLDKLVQLAGLIVAYLRPFGAGATRGCRGSPQLAVLDPILVSSTNASVASSIDLPRRPRGG